MQICAAGNSVHRRLYGFAGLSAHSPRKNRLRAITALHFFGAMVSFVSGDQSVGAAMPTTHVAASKNLHAGGQPPSTPRRFVLASSYVNREARPVDLALKLNVLAVCAVFTFVGAVLLGAF
jgi:hypothetical protein